MSEISGTLSGVAGEYFVAAELSRRGFIASITLRNTRGIDVLVSNADASRQVAIQVKTNQGDHRKAWVLNDKAETYFADNLFYVFVNLKGPGECPDYYVVPSKDVAEQVSESHRAFLGSTSKTGRPHKDSAMRMFHDETKHYLERWGLLVL